jgi:hypothetical protein
VEPFHVYFVEKRCTRVGILAVESCSDDGFQLVLAIAYT